MTIRYIRSPYIIDINETGQIGSRLELFIWNKGTTEPSTPIYTLSKSIPSSTQILTSYNVSNYIKEYIKNILPGLVTTPSEESNEMWCFFKIKRYKTNNGIDYTLLTSDSVVDSVQQIAINGYSYYSNGRNRTSNTPYLLCNTDIKLTNASSQSPYYVNLLTASTGVEYEITYQYNDGSDDVNYYLYPSVPTNYKIPISKGPKTSKIIINVDSVELRTINVEVLDECKNIPIVCAFINRFGGWQPLTFYKQQTTNITTTSKEYKMFQANSSYDTRIGQYRTMNINGKKSIKLNTGWVDQIYSELIEELLLSETVLLNGEPVIVKTKGTEMKTHLKDKCINYEIEFEYAYDEINNMI